MFGCVVSGRLVQTNFQQVDENKFQLDVPDADGINHFIIFLTGETPLPNGLSAAIYFSCPDPSAPPMWKHLGYISNEKPSEIFKIPGAMKKVDESGSSGSQQINIGSQPASLIAKIGISIEKEGIVPGNDVFETAETENKNNPQPFTRNVLENFYNYASSFTQKPADMTPNPDETYVPWTPVQNWFTTFDRRLKDHPNFWKK